MDWTDKSVLVTGGTGSFGRKMVEVLVAEYHPRRVIIFSRDELKQHDMRTQGFDDDSLRYFIGDVRDVDRLRRAMRDVQIVVHAAAMKQVPACEYNPIEGVMTNIIGARNVVDAALDNRNRNHHVEEEEVYCFKPVGPHYRIFTSGGSYEVVYQRTWVDTRDAWVHDRDQDPFESRWVDSVLCKSLTEHFA